MRAASVISWAANAAVVFTACSRSTENGAPPDHCPSDFQSLTVCTPPAGSLCVDEDPTLGCDLDALPSGLPCSGSAQCSLRIFPCPDEMQTDNYLCTCLDSHWSCEDCAPGSALCAVVPDAAPIDAAPPDATASDEDGSDGSADSGAGAPGIDMCIPSNQYAAAEPCPSTDTGTPYTSFNCFSLCSTRLVDGPSCTMGGWGTAPSGSLLTDADTIVLCCPGEWDAAVQCVRSFMMQ